MIKEFITAIFILLIIKYCQSNIIFNMDEIQIRTMSNTALKNSNFALDIKNLIEPQTPNCECTPYYLCWNNSVITDGEGLIDIRMQDGPCSSYLEVCCSIENTITSNTNTQSMEKFGNCGIRHPKGVGFRITGDKDNESQYGEFPWMVAVLYEDNLNISADLPKVNIYQCGGSLIHPRIVLTAAHCVQDIQKQKQLKIRAGEWDTQTKNEQYPHQDRDVEKVIIHEQYYDRALFNDIALLVLKTPVKLAENVDVICLPKQGSVTTHGTNCVASGWGKNVFGQKGKYQVILKKVELPFVSRYSCTKSLQKTRLGKRFQLHPSFVCAGGEPGKDTCKGDGGSPLVCQIPELRDRYVQAGIVAWGIGCGENETPGVYVNVALFRDWIDFQLEKLNITNDIYSV